MLCDLQIFSGGAYPPSATSRPISFPISNSFWLIVHEVRSVRERERERERERQRERERERERERDGSDVTVVALKLGMSLHFPLTKIHTIGDEFTLGLAKNWHFSFL